MKNEILKKCIVLTGPMFVGKSLISSELSKRTGIPRISIDEIIAFAKEEKKNELNSNIEFLEAFREREISEEFKLQHKKYPNKPIDELITEIENLVDEFISQYLFVIDMIGPLDGIYPIIEEYYDLFGKCPFLNADTELTILQERFAKVLEFVYTKIKVPCIIDTPAHLGWNPPDFNFCKKDTETLNKINYNQTPQTIGQKIRILLEMAGPKIFLEPGIDYNQRQSHDSNAHFIMTDMIDQYYDFADVFISVNNLFYDPNDKSLQTRSWLDTESNQKHNLLKNHGEISNICNQILTAINELEEEKELK